ncbi:hypothetical protein PCS78_05745 [Escherichia coli]|uniref:Protein PssL n=38 Tax=Enterobacteriaceae TaxID=543 RepID=PSSL_ECOLI|nr:MULTISPECIES: protein PssL [Enterobacteriaceae]YP_010051192.1 protein PssL [Escherichia coli str. K-12 substr. MG1655]P0DSG0.1 RecName: Full=Protein PssL [Escherichia coli K-12]MBT0969063.1 hypothetical protein [Salmonella enterica subsp. enterica serovar 1,4,[5],12:i:-]MBT9320101.1 hypothetical protein [Salmonella enterica subsp. enterica serovar Enteritidis]MBU5387961.1 hypothetical protein [Citrobacter cronae]MBU5563321.1 hypothetical protein [Escherichia sp. S69_ASV_4]MBU5598569.1 hyp
MNREEMHCDVVKI